MPLASVGHETCKKVLLFPFFNLKLTESIKILQSCLKYQVIKYILCHVLSFYYLYVHDEPISLTYTYVYSLYPVISGHPYLCFP